MNEDALKHTKNDLTDSNMKIIKDATQKEENDKTSILARMKIDVKDIYNNTWPILKDIT